MARDGLLPKGLATIRPGSRVPAAAVAVNATLLGVIALAGSVGLGVAVGGFLYVGHFVPPLLALAILRRRDRAGVGAGAGAAPAFRTPAPVVLLPLALAACATLIVTSGVPGAAGALGWLALGLLLRRLDRRRGQAHPARGPAYGER